MSDAERGFKGVWIPADIWLCKELKVMEKLFLVEISSLDNDKGCFASNAHFSEFFNVGKARCSQIINALEKKKLITIVLIRKGKSVVKRVIKCTGNSLKRVPKITPKAPQNNHKKLAEIAPLKVFKILNRVVNKSNNPIKYIKHPYLINDQGSNTKIFNNTKDNKILSKPELLIAKAVEINSPKKPGYIRDVFNRYPAHRRGGTDAQLWKLWKQEKLNAYDATKILDWLTHAAQSDPQWATDANGQFVKGITKFIRERHWLTPIPVVQQSAQPATGANFHSGDTRWSEDLGDL